MDYNRDHLPEGGTVSVIKRCVAIPGDVVAIQNKTVVVNGTPLEEPYAVWDPQPREARPDLPPTVVPPDSYYLLGDNRDHSFDSRNFGPVPISRIRGKLLGCVWPPRHSGWYEQPATFASASDSRR